MMDSKITQVRSILKSDAATEEEYKAAVQELMATGNYGDYDEAYLCALFFPEYSPAVRIPTPFGIPTTLVTQKFSFYLNTGAGDGFVCFVPQDQTSWCVFRSLSGTSSSAAAFPQWNGKNTNLHCVIPVEASSTTYLLDAFQQMRLVGGSMRVAYTGSVDEEKGFLVASHVYDKRVCEISDKAVEDGYYVTRTRPSEGIRLVYQPKDDLDFTYVNNDRKWGYGTTASTLTETCVTTGGISTVYNITAFDPSTILLGGAAAKDQLDEMPDYQAYIWKLQTNLASDYTVQTSSALGWQRILNSTEALNMPIEAMWGVGPRIGQTACPQQLVCYWKGMPEGTECLRVDVVRHFECVPRTALKDLVSVARPTHSEESLKVASRIGPNVPTMHSSTLNAADTVKDTAMTEISSGGKAQSLGHRIAKRLGQAWKGPIGTVARLGIDAGASALLGPEAGIATQALFSTLKRTNHGGGGAGGPVNTYNGVPNALGAQTLKFIQQL